MPDTIIQNSQVQCGDFFETVNTFLTYFRHHNPVYRLNP